MPDDSGTSVRSPCTNCFMVTACSGPSVRTRTPGRCLMRCSSRPARAQDQDAATRDALAIGLGGDAVEVEQTLLAGRARIHHQAVVGILAEAIVGPRRIVGDEDPIAHLLEGLADGVLQLDVALDDEHAARAGVFLPGRLALQFAAHGADGFQQLAGVW